MVAPALRRRRARLAASLAATALTCGTLVTAPASAAPATPAAPLPPEVAQLSAELEAANPLDNLGRPLPEVQDRLRELAHQPWLPPQVRDTLLSAIAFFAGENSRGGVELPENSPNFTQFYWPTVAGKCIGGTADSVGSALAVRGPSEVPAPGAAAGQTTFLFTALGTAPAAAGGDVTVRWVNLSSLTHGEVPLADHGINPEGPATVSATADTGDGPVVAVLSGTLATQDGPCGFQPTVALLPGK